MIPRDLSIYKKKKKRNGLISHTNEISRLYINNKLSTLLHFYVLLYKVIVF